MTTHADDDLPPGYDHPAAAITQQHAHKLLALLMRQLNVRHVTIDAIEMQALNDCTMVTRFAAHAVHLYLLTDAERDALLVSGHLPEALR